MKKILIIEDDQKIALALKLRLKMSGYEVLTAGDGVKGLELARAERPDLVVLDMMLPVGSGASVAFRLRQEAPELPFISLSASQDENVRRTAVKLGAAAFFEKPYEFPRLLTAIERELKDREAPAKKDPAPTRATAPANPRKILIVEDDRRIALALSARLKPAGYETAIAPDAMTGVTTAVKMKPDLVLLDISMPAGNGFSVAERIQVLIPKPTPIIFLTASKQPELRARAEELGAAGFFEKPYDSAALMEAIERALPA